MNNKPPFRLARTSALIAALTLGLGTLSAQTSSSSTSSSPSDSNYSRDTRQNTGNAASNSTDTGRESGYNARQSDSTATAPSTSNDQGSLSRSDRKLLLKIAEDGQKEVKVAQLAADRATDPNVRSFAQQLVTDHTQANSELAALAARKGVTLPSDERTDHHYNSLSSEKSGTKFDHNFVSMMTDNHEDDIDLFEKASSKADDADLRAFASKYLPTLREHQAKAKSLEKTTDNK